MNANSPSLRAGEAGVAIQAEVRRGEQGRDGTTEHRLIAAVRGEASLDCHGRFAASQ